MPRLDQCLIPTGQLFLNVIGMTRHSVQFLLKTCQFEFEWYDLGCGEGILGLNLCEEVGVLLVGVGESTGDVVVLRRRQNDGDRNER